MLRELFEVRDGEYAKATMKILETIPGTIAAIVEVSELEEEFAQGRLVWSEAVLVQEVEEEEEYVLLVGILRYEVGDEIETPVGKLTVTPDIAERFHQRIIRVGIPINLVENDDKVAIQEFLKESAEEHKRQTEEMKAEMQRRKTETIMTDFDLDQLTEEQRESLMLNTPGKPN